MKSKLFQEVQAEEKSIPELLFTTITMEVREHIIKELYICKAGLIRLLSEVEVAQQVLMPGIKQVELPQ